MSFNGHGEREMLYLLIKHIVFKRRLDCPSNISVHPLRKCIKIFLVPFFHISTATKNV